jgi:cell division initiation protein
MDRIKPIELDKATLPRVFRGYDPKVVDALLERSSREIEGLLVEQRQMRSEIDRLKSELQSYRGMESALKDALMIAQKAADETRSNAHKEAELILESARQTAFEEQHRLASEVKSLTTQIDLLQKERDRFERQFRVILQDHLRELDQLFESPSTPRTAESAPAEEAVAATAVVESQEEPVTAEA